MKAQYILIAFLFTGFFSIAQPPAPEFMVTDTDGIAHQLYANYLDSNKTVVLKLFFVNCPPCNAIAPMVEPLYQDWGGGQYDVEFFSLSTFIGDSNEAIDGYKTQYNMTFPGVGNAGGSLQVIEPYTNNTYGLFFGTPVFVVIAPDGTVTYNPRGQSLSETIDSVDIAIERTGARRAPMDFNGIGIIQNLNNEGIPNVSVQLQGLELVETSSDSTGQFSFTTPLFSEDQYELAISKTSPVKNGISVFDIIKIRKHILNIEFLASPYALLAADADQNGQISAQDVIAISKVILNQPSSIDDGPSWIFVNRNYLFLDPLNPFAEFNEGEAGRFEFNPASTFSFDLIGIKLGDVNGSY